MGISVIVHTLNEEQNIANCLESVKWADEILVIDMHSSDRTREIASGYTDRILLHPPMRYVEPARQFALEQATQDWILIVDADEMIPRSLRDRLRQIETEAQFDVVEIPRRNYFFGHEMIGAEWGPLQDRNLRFFKKWVVRHSDTIHTIGTIDKKAKKIRLDDANYALVHFNYLDVEQFFEKANRYTTITAEGQGPLLEAPSKTSLIVECVREFYWRFIKKKGYQDGIQGLCLSMFMISYRLMILQKRLLMGKYMTNHPRQAVREEYRQIAETLISEYAD